MAFRIDQRNGWVLSPVLGLCLLTVASTLLYRIDLPMATVGVVILLAVPFILVFDRRTFALAFGSFRPSVPAYLSFLFAVVLMLAPMWLGGAQFSVFQGNHFDQINYIACSAAFGRNVHSAVLSAGLNDFLANPLVIWGNDLANARPSIMYLFALYTKMAGLKLYVATYSFLVLLLALSVFPIHRFLERFTSGVGRSSIWAVSIASVCFPLGFWGQYLFDINAWSQLGSTAVLLSVVVLNSELLKKRVEGDRPTLFHYVGLAVFWAGAAYLYPENTTYHLGTICGAIAIATLFGGLAWGDAARLIGANLAGISICCLLNFDATLGFLLGQLGFGVSSGTDFWIYFQNFLFGHDNFLTYVIDTVNRTSPTESVSVKKALAAQFLVDHALSPELLPRLLSLPATIVIGLSGFYFAMPPWPMPPTARMVLNYLLLAGVLLVWRAVWKAVRGDKKGGYGPIFLFHAGFVAVFLAGLLLLLAKSQLWAFGKGFAFFSPYLVLVTLIPFLHHFGRGNDKGGSDLPRIPKSTIAIGILPVVISLYAGFLRPVAAISPDGIHYPPPYPSIQDNALKTSLRWDLDESMLAEGKVVQVDVADPFAQIYWSSAVYLRGREYFFTGPVNTFWGLPGRGKDLGHMARTEGADCRIVDVRSADNVTRMTVIRSASPASN